MERSRPTQEDMQRPNILVIQARTLPDVIVEEQKTMEQYARKADATFTYVNPLYENPHFSWEDPSKIMAQFDGAILLGTSNIDHSQPTELNQKYDDAVWPLAERILAEDYPTLGICFGHQMFARVAGGKESVGNNSDQAETGITELKRAEQGMNETVLFNGVEMPILMSFGHKDSVVKRPANAAPLGETERDHNSALKYGKNIYTFQGHPEIEDISRLKEAVRLSKNSPLGEYKLTYPLRDPVNTGIIVVNFAKDALHREVARSRKRQTTHVLAS